ncbi:hypothetical protein GCM10010345_37940 [Streptomyces canarius]|uniref:Uncharacterized protein n=1 Tax=Streptomyces canarius TaxID=285453 RepID=A0ABQ3CMG9_9ACTN|nr:hypothetical protein GCM10010345_37940 [Streptomyces canarius]
MPDSTGPEEAGAVHQVAPFGRESGAGYTAFRTVGALSDTVPDRGWPNPLTTAVVPADEARSRTAAKSG